VPPRDPEALAGALGSLLADPERAQRMGAAARERVGRLFTVERMVQQYEALYERVAGERGAP